MMLKFRMFFAGTCFTALVGSDASCAFPDDGADGAGFDVVALSSFGDGEIAARRTHRRDVLAGGVRVRAGVVRADMARMDARHGRANGVCTATARGDLDDF